MRIFLHFGLLLSDGKEEDSAGAGTASTMAEKSTTAHTKREPQDLDMLTISTVCELV